MDERQKDKGRLHRARWVALWSFLGMVGAGVIWEVTERRLEAWLSQAMDADIRDLSSLWKQRPVGTQRLDEVLRAKFLSAKQPDRLRIAWLLGRSGHLEQAWFESYLRHKDWRVREAAVFALGRSVEKEAITRGGEEKAGSTGRSVEKSEVTGQIAMEMRWLGEALQDEKAFVRYRAVQGLRRFGAAGQAYLPRLYKELQEGAPTEADLHSHDPNDPHGHSAHEHHRDPRKQQGFFCGKPPDPGWEVRFAILRELPFLQVKKKQQAAWYRLGLADKDPRVRQAAAWALGRVGKQAHEALFSGLSMGSLREREHTAEYISTLRSEELLREMLGRFEHPMGPIWYPVADLLGQWLERHHKGLKAKEEAMLSAAFCRVLSSGDVKKSRFVLRALRQVSGLGLPCVVALLRAKGHGGSLALRVVGQQLAIKAHSRTIRVEDPEVLAWLVAVWAVLPERGLEAWWVFGQAGRLAQAWLPKMLAAREIQSRYPHEWLEGLIRVGAEVSEIARAWDELHQRAEATEALPQRQHGTLRADLHQRAEATEARGAVRSERMKRLRTEWSPSRATAPSVRSERMKRLRMWRMLQNVPSLPPIWDGVLSAGVMRAGREEDREIVEVFVRHPMRVTTLWKLWQTLILSKDRALRMLAARVVERSGVAPHPSVRESFLEMLRGTPDEQRLALGVMVRVQHDPIRATRILEAVEKASPRTQIAFLRSLSRMNSLAVWGTLRGRLVSFLRSLLAARDHHLRKGALEVFAALGKEAYALRTDIRGVLRDPSPAVRQAALAALKAMGASTSSVR
ncbi:hypothetical protein L6R29_04105 [Myxococcota bacterium]|nr:hypothetical protein [Myxococcota bacterium]